MTAGGALFPARPLAVQVHALHAAAAFIEHAGVPGLYLTIDEDRVSIQVPEHLAGADTRTAAVIMLAAAAGGQAIASSCWVTADGDLAGHPVRIYTRVGDTS